MLVDVTSMMASVDSSTFGSGTVSTRTSRLPCQVTAFIATPFGRCGKRTRQQATAELRISTHTAGAETVSAESVATVPRKALILVFDPLAFAFPRHGTRHFTRAVPPAIAGTCRRRHPEEAVSVSWESSAYRSRGQLGHPAERPFTASFG